MIRSQLQILKNEQLFRLNMKENLLNITSNYQQLASKSPCGPFGTKTDMVQAFISILTLVDAETLAGLPIPVRVLAFIAFLLFLLLNGDVLTGIAKPARASASISVSILLNAEAMSSFVSKCPRGVVDIQQRKILLGQF